ncbi:MAG: hypothetical protein J6A97_10135 [Clostridia bacterium]|nr:hypothetical protein [Clostridia bacterium]
MKKKIKSVFIIVLCFISIFSFQTFALEKNDIEVSNIVLSQEKINEILALGNTYTPDERATGLIVSATAAINDDHKLLQFVGTILCMTNVVKCGFENIVVQRRTSSSSSWTHYYTFDDSYGDTNAHSVVKAVTTNTGYEYRVICNLYAKKNIFSVERIDMVSNIMAW